jgi:RNA polymerase sigma-70 factor (ECF subfamily)
MNNAYGDGGGPRAAFTLPPDQDELIKLAKCGDRQAYVELYQCYEKRLFLIIMKITKNPEDAEDILQESLMKAFVNLERFDCRSKFSTWLTRIAINSAFMMCRKRRSRLEMSIDRETDIGCLSEMQVADRAPNAEEYLQLTQRDHQVNVAILRLPDNLRVPLQTQLTEDLSVNELATVLGISVPATKSRLMRARGRVRDTLMGRMRQSVVVRDICTSARS